MQPLFSMNKIVPPCYKLFVCTPIPLTLHNYNVPWVYQGVYQPIQSMDTSSQPSSSSIVPVQSIIQPAQQPRPSFSFEQQRNSDRDTPDQRKREKNKSAVKKHRKKLNEYLKTAPENIRSMEEIEKKLDESIKETENHIKVLRDLLAANSL